MATSLGNGTGPLSLAFALPPRGISMDGALFAGPAPQSPCGPSPVAASYSSGFNLLSSAQSLRNESSRRRKVSPSPPARPVTPASPHKAKVSVIAPGAGTCRNRRVYDNLAKQSGFDVDILGRSRAPYDRYPEYWEDGHPAPNLDCFAGDLLGRGRVDRSDCLIFGSRGGQVVLPALWKARGDALAPAVVINGGCAMNLPRAVLWPNRAVTFLLVGGQDYFRGRASPNTYFASTKCAVPPHNGFTAVLYVEEMSHMPDAELLDAILPTIVKAVLSWRSTGQPPMEEFRCLISILAASGFKGKFSHKHRNGEWAADKIFGSISSAAQKFASTVEARRASLDAQVSSLQAQRLLRSRTAPSPRRNSSKLPAVGHASAHVLFGHDRFHHASASNRELPRDISASSSGMLRPASNESVSSSSSGSFTSRALRNTTVQPVSPMMGQRVLQSPTTALSPAGSVDALAIFLSKLSELRKESSSPLHRNMPQSPWPGLAPQVENLRNRCERFGAPQPNLFVDRFPEHSRHMYRSGGLHHGPGSCVPFPRYNVPADRPILNAWC